MLWLISAVPNTRNLDKEGVIVLGDAFLDLVVVLKACIDEAAGLAGRRTPSAEIRESRIVVDAVVGELAGQASRRHVACVPVALIRVGATLTCFGQRAIGTFILARHGRSEDAPVRTRARVAAWNGLPPHEVAGDGIFVSLARKTSGASAKG